MEFEKWASLGIVIPQQERSSELRSPVQLSGDYRKKKSAPNEEKDFAPLLTTEAGKCSWVRSQIPGRTAEFKTPFGTTRLITYADQTASGQPLLHIENVITHSVLPHYGNTHSDDSHVGQSTTRAVREAGEFVRRCLGGTQDEALFFCGSGTTAALKKLQECIGVTAPHFLKPRLLKMMHPDERWVVFVGPMEHHSNLLSWRESLAEVVEIPINKDGSGVDMRKLEAALQEPEYSERPKLGCFSAASNLTGIMADTRAIARLMHEHGAFVCFDFAASGPHVKIDMRAGQVEGYDALVLSPHKFVGGPSSPGILLMSKDLYLLKDAPPSTCGGGTVTYVDGFRAEDTVYVDDVEEREDAGTPASIQKIRAALAFWVKELVGDELIQRREHYFITTAIKRLQANPCIQILGNTEVERCPILSFLVYTRELVDAEDTHELKLPVPPRNFDWQMGKEQYGAVVQVGKPLHSRFVVKLLNDLFGIQARSGCGCAAPYAHTLLGVDQHRAIAIREALLQGYHSLKPGLTRLSFSYYMSNDEFEFLLSAVQFVAEHGQRFLPCYDFDWNTGEWTCKPTMKDLIIPQPGSRRLRLDSGKILKGSEVFEHGRAVNLSTMSPSEKYTYYLSAAEIFASFLPEFPPETLMVPNKQIDPYLIDFRV